MQTLSNDTHDTIVVLMNSSFREFDTQKRETFLNALSELLAYPREEFLEIKFWDACITFQALLPTVAAARLLEAYDLAKDSSVQKSEEADEMREFIDEYNVTAIYRQVFESAQELFDRLSNLFRRPPNNRRNFEKVSPLRWIYFIHGWRWEGEIVRKACNETFSELPRLLSNHFDSSTAYFDYKTGLTRRSKSLFYAAKELANKIQNLFHEFQRISTTEGLDKKDFKVVIISHSAGGVIARKCMTLDIFKHDRNKYIKHITLIASPVTGVKILEYLSNLPFVSDQVRELEYGSVFLDELNSAWSKWRKDCPACLVNCIYGPEDTVVPPTDASILDAEAISILGVDHVKVKEVSSPDDELFKTLVSFIERASF